MKSGPNGTQNADKHAVICNQDFGCRHVAEPCNGQTDLGVRNEVGLWRPGVALVVGRLTAQCPPHGCRVESMPLKGASPGMPTLATGETAVDSSDLVP